MKKMMGLSAIFLAGFLVIPGNLWLTGRVYAQEGSKPLTEEQYQELEKKRQEQWQTLQDIQKRQEDTGTRRQESDQRQQDAIKRQKAAEQGQQELDK
jgi:hypothetical protein